MEKSLSIIKWLFNSRVKIILFIIIFLVIGFWGYKTFIDKQKPNYQTTEVTKGTLITTISASGQITTANNVNITIQASGVVKDVLVKNGDSVFPGQTVATLTLDQASQQKAAAAWSSYLSTKNSLDAANAKFYSLQSAEFVANQKLINDAVARGLADTDPTYIEENANWLQAEADYKNQRGVVAGGQASLSSAALSLSQTSSTITAPVSGTVKGLTITPGAIISLSSSSSSSTSTSQVLGSINQPGPIQAQVNLSEVDSVKVSEGQKVTATLDAFPDSTFTGKIVSINTNGVVSSGVTTYPAVISFDSGNDHIYPNMGVNAKIITSIKNDTLLVPSAAVQLSNGSSVVRILKNGQVTEVPVEIGDSNDTQTEIISGLNVSDMVITGVTSPVSSNQSTSPFSATGRGGFGGGGFGGGAARGGGR